jgi:hypothetical protein
LIGSVVLDFDDSKVALWDFEIKAGGSLGRCCFLRSAEIPANRDQQLANPAMIWGRRETPALVHE